jgi:hypothetical protein
LGTRGQHASSRPPKPLSKQLSFRLNGNIFIVTEREDLQVFLPASAM